MSLCVKFVVLTKTEALGGGGGRMSDLIDQELEGNFMQSYNRRHNCSDTLILMGPFSPSPSSPGQCCVSFFCPRLLTTAAQH